MSSVETAIGVIFAIDIMTPSNLRLTIRNIDHHGALRKAFAQTNNPVIDVTYCAEQPPQSSAVPRQSAATMTLDQQPRQRAFSR